MPGRASQNDSSADGAGGRASPLLWAAPDLPGATRRRRLAGLIGGTRLHHPRYGPDSAVWRFEGPDGPEQIHVTSSFRATTPRSCNRAVLAGNGVSMVPEALIVDDIRAARCTGCCRST